MRSSHGVFACTFGGFCAILQKAARLSHTVLLLQLIPARGRKHAAENFFVHAMGVATYPREGTETSIDPILTCHSRLQLIPARGRKLPCYPGAFQLFPVATYPREGTETTMLSWCISAFPGCNLSPRGDGNMAAFSSFTAVVALQLIPARGRKQPS